MQGPVSNINDIMNEKRNDQSNCYIWSRGLSKKSNMRNTVENSQAHRLSNASFCEFP